MKKFLCMILCLTSAVYASGSLAAVLPGGGDEIRYALDYHGGTLQKVETEEIYYDHYVSDSYVNPYKLPTFSSGLNDACAVNAGGNAIVYFDRLFDDLIPGYAHKTVLGHFNYGGQNQAVTDMFATLYSLMGTSSLGTTVDGFKKGMRNYVSSKGHTMTLTRSTGSYHNVNLDNVKARLKEEKLVAFFMHDFAIAGFGGFEHYDDRDEITSYFYDGYHVMLAYGYNDIYYYNADGSLKSRDTYLYAFTGYLGAELGLLNLKNCITDDVYILEVA